MPRQVGCIWGHLITLFLMVGFLYGISAFSGVFSCGLADPPDVSGAQEERLPMERILTIGRPGQRVTGGMVDVQQSTRRLCFRRFLLHSSR